MVIHYCIQIIRIVNLLSIHFKYILFKSFNNALKQLIDIDLIANREDAPSVIFCSLGNSAKNYQE